MKILLTYRNTIPIVTFNTSQSLKLHVQGTHACINLDHTGSEGAQVTILSYDIYQTLKLLVTRVVLTLASLDQMAYKSQSSFTIFIKL